MLKSKIAVVGLGLCGGTIAYGFQSQGYPAYIVNGSEQDNKSLKNARNILTLEKYDGLAGNRDMAYQALKENKEILKKMIRIEQPIILLCASGGGSTGSGTLPLVLSTIKAHDPDKIVVPIIVMPRKDESIQKRLNAYNIAKEINEFGEDSNAFLFVTNEYSRDLAKINRQLISMLDAFFSDDCYSIGSNFDDSEKMRMLSDPGMFIISMLSSNKEGGIPASTVIESLTTKNIFLPLEDDSVVSNIGIINQKDCTISERSIASAIGEPENIFIGGNSSVNIVCLSGLSFPATYLSTFGKEALRSQEERLARRSGKVLEDLEIKETELPHTPKVVSKKKSMGFDLLRELD